MPIARETIERLIASGAQAPSGDNLQPWIVQVDGDVIHLSVDPSRDRSLYNFKCRASLIALGAMIENITIAGREFGIDATVELVETPAELVSAVLRLEAGTVSHDPLFSAIARRCSNRKPYSTTPLDGRVLASLRAAVPPGSRATVTMIEDRLRMRTVARAASLNDRLLFEWRPLHDRFFESIRWTEAEAEATRDGLFVKTLELGALGVSFKAFRSWSLLTALNLAGASRTAPIHSFQTFMRSAAFAYVEADRVGPIGCVEGGRLAQRLWLTATEQGVAVQPMAGMLCLLPYVREPEVSGISPAARALIAKAHVWFREVLPLDGQPILLVRLGLGPLPTAVSLRRVVRAKGSALPGLDQ
jgi:hypothetical protein